MKNYLLALVTLLLLNACSDQKLTVIKGKPGGIYLNGNSGDFYPAAFNERKQLNQEQYVSFDQIEQVSKGEHNIKGMYTLTAQFTPEGAQFFQEMSKDQSEVQLNFVIHDSIIISPIAPGGLAGSSFEVTLRGEQEIDYIIDYLTQR